MPNSVKIIFVVRERDIKRKSLMHHPSGLGDFHFCQMNFFSLIHNNLPLDKSMILTKLLVIYSQPG